MKPSKEAKPLSVNVTKENKSGSTPVPAGVYQARAAFKAGTTKDGLKDMMKVEFSLIGKDPNGKKVTDRKVFDNITFEESMIWKWNALYEAATGEEMPDGTFTFDEMIGIVGGAIQGKVVNIEVSVEEYDGKETNKVVRYLK